MNAIQFQQVKAVMEALWASEDAAPRPEHPSVCSAGEKAAVQLESILQGSTDESDPRNAGLSWRYLGDACFLWSGKENETALRRGRNAYLRAEPLLALANDEMEMAKLQFNMANLSRLIDNGRNREMREDARRRYLLAGQLFEQTEPALVKQVQASLESLAIGDRNLSFMEKAEADKKTISSLQARLDAARQNPALIPEVCREFRDMQKNDPTFRTIGFDYTTFVEQSAPLLRRLDSKQESRDDEIRSSLDELRKLIELDAGPGNSSDVDLFNAVFDALEKAYADGEVSAERKETIHRFLSKFRSVSTRPAYITEDFTRKDTEMLDVIAQFLPLFLKPELGAGTK